MGIPKSSRLCRRHSVSFLGCRRSRLARLDQRGRRCASTAWRAPVGVASRVRAAAGRSPGTRSVRSEEHTSELQSLMRISYAVFCLKKKKKTQPDKDKVLH